MQTIKLTAGKSEFSFCTRQIHTPSHRHPCRRDVWQACLCPMPDVPDREQSDGGLLSLSWYSAVHTKTSRQSTLSFIHSYRNAWNPPAATVSVLACATKACITDFCFTDLRLCACQRKNPSLSEYSITSPCIRPGFGARNFIHYTMFRLFRFGRRAYYHCNLHSKTFICRVYLENMLKYSYHLLLQ